MGKLVKPATSPITKTNYVLSELAEKGILKIKRFKSAPKKIPYTYMLTPEGLEEKAKITLKFLKRKISEYEEIKHQIKEITKESEKEKACTTTSEQPAKL